MNEQKKVLKLKREYKVMVKDLEAQIDFLIGYKPLGMEYKKEYYARLALIDEAINSGNCPPEIVEKILRIQDALERLRQGLITSQEYLYHGKPYTIEHPIIVKEGSQECLLDDYLEQEKYRRPNNFNIENEFKQDKVENIKNFADSEMGILNKENVFKAYLAYLRFIREYGYVRKNKRRWLDGFI